MDEQLLRDLVKQLQDLVPVLRLMGPSSASKGDPVEKASVVFDRSSSKIVTAIGKLAAQLDKNTRGKKAEERSLAQFVKEVDRAADAQEKAAQEVADFASEIDAAGKLVKQSQQESAEVTTKSAKDIAKARYGEYQKEQALLTNYAAMQARDMLAVSDRQNTLAGTLERLGGTTAESQLRMLKFGRFIEGAGKALGELGNLGKSVARTLADLGQNGATSFTQLNGVVDSVAGAISKMGASIPFFGAAMTALAEGAKFALQSIQQVSDNFREAAKVGALTADGMNGLANASIESGISQKALLGTIRENSVAFSQLGGTVGDGTKQFTKFVGGITKTPLGMQLRNLGLGADDIAESAAAFVSLQGRLGATQRMTNDQLTEGTIRYTRELDAISKITGMERKELQGKMNAALSEQRFRAKMQEMERTGQGETAKQLNQFQAAVGKTAPGLAQGLRDIIAAGGAVTTDAARQAMNATGGQISRIAREAIDGKDIGKSLGDLQQSVAGGAQRFEKTAQFADISGVVGNYAELVDFSTTAAGDLGKAFVTATETVGKQAAGADELTNKVVGAQQSLELAAKEAEKFALEMVNYATPAVAAFADMLAKSTAKLNEILGTGAKPAGGGIMGSLEGGGKGAIGGAIVGGIIGAIGGPAGAILGAKIGAVVGTGIGSYVGGAPGGGAGGAAAPGGGGGGGGGGGRAAPATGGATTTQGLAAAGLKLRPSGGDIQQEGSAVSPKLIALAKQIQSAVPGFSYFSGFNDAHHQAKGREYSQHNKGQALDFALNKKPSVDEGKEIVSKIKSMGGGQVLDEYNFPSPGATAGHIHVGIPEFAKGGIASGPKSGYKAMLHGTEAVVPLPDGKQIPVNMQNSNGGNLTKQMDMMSAQLMRLDEMVSLMRRQVGVSDKMLRVSQS